MWPRAAKSPHGKVYPGSSQGTGRVCSWGFGVGLSLGRAEKHSCNSLCERPRARGSRKAVCQGLGKRLQPLQGFAARPPRHTGSPASSSPAQGSLAAATRLREPEMDRSCSGVRCHIHLHRPGLQHISLSFPDPRPPPDLPLSVRGAAETRWPPSLPDAKSLAGAGFRGLHDLPVPCPRSRSPSEDWNQRQRLAALQAWHELCG